MANGITKIWYIIQGKFSETVFGYIWRIKNVHTYKIEDECAEAVAKNKDGERYFVSIGCRGSTLLQHVIDFICC